MKKLLFSSILFFTFIGNIFSLSENTRVSIITVDSGDELYSYFGHSAIRISDPETNIDNVYNFGTFDFSTPNFYLKFTRGDLNYCLDVSDFDYFFYVSEYEERNLIEQVLILNYEEKKKLYEILENTYNSSDRYYRYDFFKNNCATKIRDVIEEATNKRIDFSKANYSGHTFRELISPLISKNYWITFLINLALGTHSDEYASPSDYMFLPMYIQYFLENDQYVSETYKYTLATAENDKTGFNFSYIHAWIIILIIFFFSRFTKTRIYAHYFIMTAIGLIGLLILILSLYSLHRPVTYNLNIIWTLPALLTIAIQNKKINSYLKYIYLLILAITYILSSFTLLGQSTTFLPWIVILIYLLLQDLNIIPSNLMSFINKKNKNYN